MRRTIKVIYKLLDIAKRAHTEDHDSLFLIVGFEGRGKSNLALLMNEYWAEQNEQDTNIEFIALDQRQFTRAMNLAKDNPRKGAVIYDEAGEGLLARDAMGDYNKDMIKMFTVNRERSILTIMILPNIYYLEKYFREHRVKGLFCVYKRCGKRHAHTAFWDKDRIDKILMMTAHTPVKTLKQLNLVKPLYDDITFPPYNGKLLKKYREKKAKMINDLMQEMSDKYASPEEKMTEDERFITEKTREGWTQFAIGDALGITHQAVSQRTSTLRKKGIKMQALQGNQGNNDTLI